MTGQIIIEAKDVRRDFKLGDVEVHALRGIDLSVGRGEFLVILGPSGSGKTTLLNCLGGIDSPTSGTIKVDGKDISSYNENRLSEYRRNKVGWVFQFFNLIPSLTAVENVALALEMAHDRKDMMKRSLEALSLVGIPDKANMFPSQLSGGEQQRVAIARALVKKPAIVLADEPTGNLDWVTGQKTAQLMKDLNKKEGITFIVVSHDISITSVADRVLHLMDGQISRKKFNDPGAKKVMEE
ncbi:MAG TPA: ABC transporter ATP-binding protein [Euryarchaeota archaeon]|nr:MAG: macrolide ABC transporter ATP-binding protein [Thermoplasmatales archaeon ex4484_6]HHD16592.1 ABC transporter ATP-binding protein [Euryarchaeota archaeon]